MLESILSLITWREALMLLVAAWLVFAIVKRLAKLAVLAAVIFALVYFVYPLVAPVFNSH